MSLHRTKATIIGLLEASRVNEWVVTEKLGDALKDKAGGTKVHKKHRFSIGNRYKMDKILTMYLIQIYFRFSSHKKNGTFLLQ
jgi:beta-mannan synthase